MKNSLPWYFFFLLMFFKASSQHPKGLDYFLGSAEKNNPALLENSNLQKTGTYQDNLLIAQHKSFQIYATSEVLFAPYFNNSGKAIDITSNPSGDAIGYDVGITNGGLYSAQLNVTKNLFNQSAIDNLLFQNKIKNEAINLSSAEIVHNFNKNITDLYINTYQLQLQKEFTREILNALDTRLKVVELLVKRAILMESDYLLLQLDIENKKLELLQIENNFETSIEQLHILSSNTSENMDSISKPNIALLEKPIKFNYNKRFENDSLQISADQQVLNNQYKPQLAMYANTGLNAVELNKIEHKFGASAGFRFSVPIYDGGQRRYTEIQNNYKKESLQYLRANSELKLKNQLESILRQIKSMDENLILMDQQLQNQTKILEVYKGKLVQGQVSIVDYLNVIQNYKQNVYAKLQMQTNHWLLINQYNYINW